MMDVKKFENYINESNYIYTKKRGLMYAFKRMQLWESATKTNIDKWNKNFLIKLCKEGVDLEGVERPNDMEVSEFVRLSEKISMSSYYGLYTNLLYINEVLSFFGRDDLNLTTNDFQDCRIEKTNLFTKQEIIDICNSLVNVQDKFIIYGLFSGIRGNKYEDLVKLKVKDINFDTKEIKLPSGKIIAMDSYLEDILIDLTDEEFGSYYYKLNRSGNYDINSFYKFNMNSEYVIKVKPTCTNGDGLGCMSFQGLQTRFKGLSNILGTSILGVNVYRSGVISRMHDIKEVWVQSEILNYLKENEYNLTAYETQRAYEDVYGKA